MEDYKVVLKYQELSVIASLRRFADTSLFGHNLSVYIENRLFSALIINGVTSLC
jgi:hypothetical protein